MVASRGSSPLQPSMAHKYMEQISCACDVGQSNRQGDQGLSCSCPFFLLRLGICFQTGLGRGGGLLNSVFTSVTSGDWRCSGLSSAESKELNLQMRSSFMGQQCSVVLPRAWVVWFGGGDNFYHWTLILLIDW